jgi:hypothetical protein
VQDNGGEQRLKGAEDQQRLSESGHETSPDIQGSSDFAPQSNVYMLADANPNRVRK